MWRAHVLSSGSSVWRAHVLSPGSCDELVNIPQLPRAAATLQSDYIQTLLINSSIFSNWNLIIKAVWILICKRITLELCTCIEAPVAKLLLITQLRHTAASVQSAARRNLKKRLTWGPRSIQSKIHTCKKVLGKRRRPADTDHLTRRVSINLYTYGCQLRMPHTNMGAISTCHIQIWVLAPQVQRS